MASKTIGNDRVWRETLASAHHYGEIAASATRPNPMVVEDPASGKLWRIPEGPCGFAWVNIPGNSGLARYCRKNNIGHKDYRRGWNIWISAYNQSYELKLAHARGMAEYLKGQGITAWASGRLD
jgi:hypothetical protein